MSLEILKNELKKGAINQVYLFFGPEGYLVQHYLKEAEKTLIESKNRSFNYHIFDGKGNEHKIINAAETMPFMNEKKLIVIKDSGLFGKNKKNELDQDDDNLELEAEVAHEKGKEKQDVHNIIEYIEGIPEGVHFIFVENEINKNTKAYKTIKKIGICVQFDYQTMEQLEKWVIRIFDSYKIRATKEEAGILIHLCNFSMIELMNEINKLAAYLGEGAQLKLSHIEKICPKRLQNKVFDMMDAVGQKNTILAFELLNDMLVLKEPPQKIILLLARHFKLMLYIKHMKSKKYASEKIADKISLHSFIVGKYLKQCEHFSLEKLQEAMDDCLTIDRNIKTGKMEPRMALETFVGKYA